MINRGLNEETRQEFRIGYAKDSWDDLMNLLKKRGFTETEIFQAGLTVKKDNGYSYYDRFRDRVIFPIQDAHGNVIGFTARTLKAEENAKYLNTPEGMLYHKGDVLYALDKARNVIRQKDYAVVVEGNIFCDATDSCLRLDQPDWSAGLKMDRNVWHQASGPLVL